MLARDQQRAPAARPGIALAGSVRVTITSPGWTPCSARPPNSRGLSRRRLGRAADDHGTVRPRGADRRHGMHAFARLEQVSAGQRRGDALGPVVRASCPRASRPCVGSRAARTGSDAPRRFRSRAGSASHACGARSSCRAACGGKLPRATKCRAPHGPQGLNAQITTLPSPTSTRSTSRSSSCGRAGVFERVRQQHRLDGIGRDGQRVELRADRSRGPFASGAIQRRCCVRAPAHNAALSPQRPICSSSNPKTSASSSCSSRVSSASTAAPRGDVEPAICDGGSGPCAQG